MKRIVMMLAFVASMLAVNAQIYNYFEPADCDADGWLWLDSAEKIKKYCGFATKTKKFKVMLEAATYEDANMEYPEPTTSATVKGYNTAGVQGGEGSHTGGIILPVAEETAAWAASISGYGGAVMFYLPDCAELSLYFSSKSKDIHVALFGAEGEAKVQNLQGIRNFSKTANFLNDPLRDADNKLVTYAGAWRNLESYELSEYRKVTLKSVKGEAKTAYICNLNDTDPLILHGLKIMTYTDTNAASVADITADDKDSQAYNLFGMPVDDDYKGIVIKNGKKYIRK